MQPNPLMNPSAWVTMVESLSQNLSVGNVQDNGVLQRKVRAHGNFAEYVPHGLLLIVGLELMEAQVGLVWLLGSTLTVARIAHAYGVITKYGPSVGFESLRKIPEAREMRTLLQAYAQGQ